MKRKFIALFCLLVGAVSSANAASVLVLRFHNSSPFQDLDWIGESISETLGTEFGAEGQIVMSRSARTEALKRLSLRANVEYTKATLIRLGQTLDVDYVCFGSFDATLPTGETDLRNSNIQITAQFIDLRRMHDGPEISENGKTSELARLEEHLAYESLKYLDTKAPLSLDAFLSPEKSIRLDAEESFVRGLLSTHPEQKQKWFAQAANLDPKFMGPVYELGRLALSQKQYAQAIDWLRRIPASDPNYAEAQFRMGLAAYGEGDYAHSADYFREVVKTFPLSETYNDLGAAELAMNRPAAVDDFRHALETAKENPKYLYNLALALTKNGQYQDAAKSIDTLLASHPDDADAKTLLERDNSQEPFTAKVPPARLDMTFDETAFRQLKAMLGATK